MTAGRGFIALAAMISGKWESHRGFRSLPVLWLRRRHSDALQEIGIPTQFVQMMPYVLTMIALIGFIGRAVAPKASGQPYVKEG